MVTIQAKDFSIEHISNKVRGNNSNVGAVVTFVGYVRDFDKKDSKHLINMDLEHYPGMTEKVLEDIEEKAKLVTDLIFNNVGGREQFDQVDVQLIRTDHLNPNSNEEAQASLRISVMSQNPDLVGRLWFGTMDNPERNIRNGSLYCLDKKLSLYKVDTKYYIPNGPAFINKNTFYDHRNQRNKYTFYIDDIITK